MTQSRITDVNLDYAFTETELVFVVPKIKGAGPPPLRPPAPEMYYLPTVWVVMAPPPWNWTGVDGLLVAAAVEAADDEAGLLINSTTACCW